ncbi:hypothetical protein ACFL7D_07805 [candidate division KSB1 bacterium]
MVKVEGEIISSFESGVIIDNYDFRRFFIKNNENEICIVVKPDCPDFNMCINELFYKLYNKKFAIVTGSKKPIKGVKCRHGIIAESVRIENAAQI